MCTLADMFRLKLAVFVTALAIGGGVLAPMSTAGAVGDLSTVHVGLTPVATGLANPVALAWRTNDAGMYVVQQNGRIQRVVGGVKTPAGTIKVRNDGEQGLLGLVFSANGAKAYL